MSVDRRVLPRFPAKVAGAAGISATLENGVIVIGIDPTNLSINNNPTAPGNYAIILNQTADELQISLLSSIVSGQAVIDFFDSLPDSPAGLSVGDYWLNSGIPTKIVA